MSPSEGPLFYGSIFLSLCRRSFLTSQRHPFVFEQAKHVLWRTWFICCSWKRSEAVTLAERNIKLNCPQNVTPEQWKIATETHSVLWKQPWNIDLTEEKPRNVPHTAVFEDHSTFKFTVYQLSILERMEEFLGRAFRFIVTAEARIAAEVLGKFYTICESKQDSDQVFVLEEPPCGNGMLQAKTSFCLHGKSKYITIILPNLSHIISTGWYFGYNNEWFSFVFADARV